jgi:hypothetical protein
LFCDKKTHGSVVVVSADAHGINSSGGARDGVAVGLHGLASAVSAGDVLDSLMARLQSSSFTTDSDRLEILEAIGTTFSCELVLLWQPNGNHEDLHCVLAWQPAAAHNVELQDLCRTLVVWPVESLAGRVWVTRRSELLVQLADDGHSGRAMHLAKAGLRTGAAFAVAGQTDVRFVIELFSSSPSGPIGSEGHWRDISHRIADLLHARLIAAMEEETSFSS